MLTEDQILLVRTTWKKLYSIDPAIVSGTFYARLFADHPAMKKMFPKDMDLQYVKLMDMLSVIVLKLDRLEELSNEIADMAERHVGYGVRPEHFKLVGAALLWTLEKGLVNDWTPAVKSAWSQAYSVLSHTMIHASRKTH